MCVIAVKPKGIAFPEEKYLKNCFANNPDGAGFMTVANKKVVIRKGLMTYKAFKKALNESRRVTGDDAPYVMHFRIATQGFTKSCTHPFPLTDDMEEMKKLKTVCDVGVAHNGIISLTSDGNRMYSDTMLFIADYLSLIADSPKWWGNKNKKRLVENLIDGSRLAILDKSGHIELMGLGWHEEGGISYSNLSYSYKKELDWAVPAQPIPFQPAQPIQSDFDLADDFFCPLAETGDKTACDYCKHRFVCFDSFEEFIERRA